MHNVAKSNYHENEKNSTIYTPEWLSQKLFSSHLIEWVNGAMLNGQTRITVLDPCCGKGALTKPWKEWSSSIRDDGWPFSFLEYDLDPEIDGTDFLEIESLPTDIDVCLMNPPFNGSKKGLYPWMFLEKVDELTAHQDSPPLIVMFSPYGLRLNQRAYTKSGTSKRVAKMMSWRHKITSVFSLPMDAFPGVQFHCEVLVFNEKSRTIPPHAFIFP